MLKHAQAKGQMSIWTRVGCHFGIVEEFLI
jgi:hypothetical protein